MPDPVAVNSMFARIAARYDVANRLLSGGTDVWWRAKMVRLVAKTKPSLVLDLATGSGDVAFALCKKVGTTVKIIGVDFCQPMLDQAIKKQNREKNCISCITFIQGDGLNLPFEDAHFSAATISFGLRNMANRHRCLCELYRVLRPSGRLYILEFSQPWRWVRPFYYFYTNKILPKIAGLLTGDSAAYAYLNTSIAAYPGHEAMSEELKRAGFQQVTVKRMTCGIVALHVGQV
jgi:demethylmenaquinone methyltransferase / 2-methoxy-6-polyprenyl-1,4-benzoquinol methylase